LMGITLNLQTDFDNMVVFTILFFWSINIGEKLLWMRLFSWCISQNICFCYIQVVWAFGNFVACQFSASIYQI
jgi:hypothetical protein